MAYRTLDGLAVAGKRVILRGDLNVPAKDGKVTDATRLERLAPFIEGMVMLAWATASFWLPVVVAIGVWRHRPGQVPLRYAPQYWSLVFPLAMYGTATYAMRAALGVGPLGWLPGVVLVAALAAWSAAAAGLVGQAVTRRRRP